MQYPEQWQQAGDVYSRLANQGYQMPQAWQQGQDWMNQLWGQQGSPVDVSGMWNTLMPQVQRAYDEQAGQIGEQWGAMNPGVAGGSGKNRAQTDMWSRLMENMAGNVMGAGITSQENAMNRMYGLPGMQYNYGLGEAGLMSDTANRQLGAAGGLQSLGGQYANLPMQLAGYMGNLGGQLTGQQVDPWTQWLGSMFGQTQGVPQTYNPSMFQDILRGLPTALGSFGGWGGGGKGGGTLSTTPGASIW